MWWNLIFRFKKQLLIIAASLSMFGGGYWYALSSTEPTIVKEIQIVEKVIEKEVIIEKEVFVEVSKEDTEKTTTVTEKPDGSKVTVISEKTSKGSTKDHSKDANITKDISKDKKTKEIPIVIHKKVTKYKLGFFAANKLSSLGKKEEADYGLSGSIRLAGPVWVDSSYQIRNHELTLGVSVEF